MLRIDPAVTEGGAYGIPPDNPFVDVEDTAPEIWSTGLRNPWRFSFDRETGDLWIADVGQNAMEEIDVAPATGGVDAGKGLFFGWSAFEGVERYNDDVDPEGHVPPIFTYSHGDGCSISGGVRVRGGPVPALAGWYVYADYCAGQVWALQITGEGASLAAGRQVELGEVAVTDRCRRRTRRRGLRPVSRWRRVPARSRSVVLEAHGRRDVEAEPSPTGAFDPHRRLPLVEPALEQDQPALQVVLEPG